MGDPNYSVFIIVEVKFEGCLVSLLGALYSFAIVLFFTDYVKEACNEAIMRRYKYDFDWEKHAEDVGEESNRA